MLLRYSLLLFSYYFYRPVFMENELLFAIRYGHNGP